MANNTNKPVYINIAIHKDKTEHWDSSFGQNCLYRYLCFFHWTVESAKFVHNFIFFLFCNISFRQGIDVKAAQQWNPCNLFTISCRSCFAFNDSRALANIECQVCLKCIKIQKCNFQVWKALRISFLQLWRLQFFLQSSVLHQKRE